VCAVAAWDSSIHDSIYLNRVTEGQCKAYFDQWDAAACSLVDDICTLQAAHLYLPIQQHGSKSQNTVILIFTAVRGSNLSQV